MIVTGFGGKAVVATEYLLLNIHCRIKNVLLILVFCIYFSIVYTYISLNIHYRIKNVLLILVFCIYFSIVYTYIGYHVNRLRCLYVMHLLSMNVSIFLLNLYNARRGLEA